MAFTKFLTKIDYEYTEKPFDWEGFIISQKENSRM
ncbi:hypothetical protein J3D55_004277 [Chryseobacterium ginsenosidimutans]|nr:hypothetical protein [Chryseobacterium ginsenosidimutans]